MDSQLSIEAEKDIARQIQSAWCIIDNVPRLPDALTEKTMTSDQASMTLIDRALKAVQNHMNTHPEYRFFIYLSNIFILYTFFLELIQWAYN